ncbi:phage tail protein [Vibrio crassostreae]|uniref:phage tail protein n=1 Tax=Vibrio crassostreae TaxID=246167 RepID=UPI001B30E600|nr:phage tail protein [Vibrio crassostreae]
MNQMIISIPEDNKHEAFVFGLASGTAYESLNRESKGGWLNMDIINGKPVSQHTSSPLDTLSIQGKWFGADGMKSINTLREINRLKKPVMLTDTYGYNLGMWKFMQVSERQRRVIDDGTAMVVEFSLQLEEYGNG